MDSRHLRASSFAIVAALAVTLFGPSPHARLRADDKIQPAKKEAKAVLPLRKGMKWEYHTTLDLGEKVDRRYVEEVTDSVKFNDLQCFEITKTIIENGKPRYWFTEYLHVGPEYVLVAGSAHGDGTKFKPEPTDRLVRLDYAKPATWDKVTEYDFMSGGKKLHNRDQTACSQDGSSIEHNGKLVDAVLVVRTHPNPDCKDRDWYLPGVGRIRSEYSVKGVVRRREVLTAFTDAAAGKSSVALGAVTLSPTLVEREASVESVEAVDGVVTEFTKKRTIVREVSFTTKVGGEVAVEKTVGAELYLVQTQVSAKVKASIERASGEKMSDTETREQVVKIDGSKLPKANIVWIDVYRVGTIDVTGEGGTTKVPFQFPVGTKLVIRKP